MIPSSDPYHSIRDARRALADGNDGRARVSSRMAVGIAAQMAAFRLGRDYGTDVMANLRGVRDDRSLADEIRAAAERLLGGPRDIASGSPFSTDPIGDAEMIIGALMALIPDSDSG